MNRHQRRANAKLASQPIDPNAAGLIELGLKCHEAGKLNQAEQYYRRVLAINPNHPDAIQLIGSIACQVGRYDVGAEWISRAIELNGNNSSWFSNLGLAFAGQGKFEEALVNHDKAIEIRPRYPEAFNNRGNALKSLGRLDEALASYDRALALNPDHAEALNNRGNVLRVLHRFDEALAGYDRALELKPGYADAFNNRGVVLKDMGRCEEAIASYDKALALNPDFVEAHNNRGVALVEIRRHDEAMSSYNKALELRPGFYFALNNRGNLLQELDRDREALADYDKASALNPDDADIANGRGGVLRKLHRLHEAEQTLRRAIVLRPDYAEACCNLGEVYLELGRLAEAEMTIRRAIELKPDSIAARYSFAKLLIDVGRFDQAESEIRHAIVVGPHRAEAHFNLGNILLKLGRPKEAMAATRQAIALNPDLPGAYHNISLALMQLGRLHEAREAVERAIAMAPREPLHFRQLGDVRKYVVGDPYLTALEALSVEEPSFAIGKQINLHFALAKAHADVGRPEDEFQRLLAGNRLKRSIIAYDETAVLGQIDRIQQVFSAEFMGAERRAGAPSAKPIFILGMPRSGTSLIEQILASHPQVFGAGELTSFERAMIDTRSAVGTALPYPELALQMSDQHFRELGARYLDGIQRLTPTASHITDKMPANFVFAGLIHLALPNATIIHAVRDPVDTCISCFSKLFTEGNFQTYDLAEIGRYYRRYHALMAHWHQVLPPGRILDVVYEETVADLEGMARRILSHCGLPWDERCLDFHRTERVVRTSSAAQVRRPIYHSSVGRRHAYEPMLGPLLKELSPQPPSSEVATG